MSIPLSILIQIKTAWRRGRYFLGIPRWRRFRHHLPV